MVKSTMPGSKFNELTVPSTLIYSLSHGKNAEAAGIQPLLLVVSSTHTTTCSLTPTDRSSQAPVWFSAVASLHSTASVLQATSFTFTFKYYFLLFSSAFHYRYICIRDSVLLNLPENVKFQICKVVLFLAVALTVQIIPLVLNIWVSLVC